MATPKFQFGDVVYRPDPCPCGNEHLGSLSDEEVYLVLSDTRDDNLLSTEALVLDKPNSRHVVGSYNTLYAMHYELAPGFVRLEDALKKGESS